MSTTWYTSTKRCGKMPESFYQKPLLKECKWSYDDYDNITLIKVRHKIHDVTFRYRVPDDCRTWVEFEEKLTKDLNKYKKQIYASQQPLQYQYEVAQLRNQLTKLTAESERQRAREVKLLRILLEEWSTFGPMSRRKLNDLLQEIPDNIQP